MKISKYWELFRKRGHVSHFFLLALGFLLLTINIIGFFSSKLGIGNILWGGLGAVIIIEVFQNLKSKEVSGQEQTQEIPFIQQKRNFWSFLPLILFIPNVVIAIEVWSQPNLGLEAVLFIIHLVLMFFSIPAAIFAYLGRFKVASNIIAVLLLLPPIIIFIYPFLSSI